MELRQLRTLLAIVEQGGYGRAAEALGYTQSAVTAQIRQLEEELGFPLFERMGRRMVLTERGAVAVDKARRLLQLSDELLRMGEDGGLSGVLRVDMAESLLCYRMQPVLRAFRSQAPQVELILRSAGCRDIARHVRSGQCDLGVGYDDPQWRAEPFSTEVWGECQMSLLFSPRLSPPDLALPCQRLTVPYIADEPDSTFRRQLEHHLRQQDITLAHTLELWSIEAIKRCTVSGLGFAYLPRFTAQPELETGELLEMPLSLGEPDARLLCIRHKNHQPSPAMVLFLRLLHAQNP